MSRVSDFAPPLPEGPPEPGAATSAVPDQVPVPEGQPAVALLPRGVGEVVDTAIAIYRSNWRLIAGTAAVVVVPLELVNALLNRNYFTQLHQTVSSVQSGTPPTSSTNPTGTLGVLLLLLALPFLTAALATAAASCYMGRPTTVGQVWRTTLRRFWAILGLGVLHFLLLGAGFFLFVVPGVFLAVKLVVCPVALVVEGAGPVTALERSWRLTGRHWWRSAGVEVLKGFVGGFGLLLIEVPALVLGYASGGAGWVFLGLAGSLGQVFVAPLAVVATVVLYFDLRIRREAFDLFVTAQQVRASAAA